MKNKRESKRKIRKPKEKHRKNNKKTFAKFLTDEKHVKITKF